MLMSMGTSSGSEDYGTAPARYVVRPVPMPSKYTLRSAAPTSRSVSVRAAELRLSLSDLSAKFHSEAWASRYSSTIHGADIPSDTQPPTLTRLGRPIFLLPPILPKAMSHSDETPLVRFTDSSPTVLSDAGSLPL